MEPLVVKSSDALLGSTVCWRLEALCKPKKEYWYLLCQRKLEIRNLHIDLPKI